MPASNPDSPKTAPTKRSAAWHWRSALAGGLISAGLLGGGVLVVRQPDPPAITVYPPPPEALPALTAEDDTPALVTNATAGTAGTAGTDITARLDATPAPLVVFVSGAVAVPAVYEVPPGARVHDAVQAAGGLTAAANPAAVNLAEPLHDGAQIHIPTLVEAPAEPPAGISSAPVTTNAANPATAAGALSVNVNTASAAQLDELPGIGPSRAADIIAGRPYATVDELDRVPGIGEATLNELRPYVVVE